MGWIKEMEDWANEMRSWAKEMKGETEMPMTKCLTPKCKANAGAGLRGLCMKCYKAAKDLVDKGETDWDELTGMGLAEAKEGSAFFEEFKKRKWGTI